VSKEGRARRRLAVARNGGTTQAAADRVSAKAFAAAAAIASSMSPDTIMRYAENASRRKREVAQ